MRWVVAALLIAVLAGCAAPSEVVDERPDVWVSFIEDTDEEFSFMIVSCADTRIFQGAFIPFEFSVGDRSRIIDEYGFEPYNDSCISIEYVIESEYHETLLSEGSFSVVLDPRDTINESDERNNRFVYEPSSICIDADGDNPFLSSFVTARIDGESLFLLDRCANETATEFVCDGTGRIEPLLYNCTDGCVSGACRCLNSGTCLTDGSATRI